MTFRTRLTLLAAVAVAFAIAAVAPTVFLATRSLLRAQVDETLRDIAAQAAPEIVALPPSDRERIELALPVPPPGIIGGYAQLVGTGGVVDRIRGTPNIPITDRARAVARGAEGAFLEDATADGIHLRVYTVPFGSGLALQLARPLQEIDAALRRLALILGIVAVVGIGGAAGLGFLVSRAALRPVRHLTVAAERVTATGDPGHRIEVRGRDELGRLARAFNDMLEALESSQQTQRQLVTDASHELRTPLTSLRTNLEVLARGYRLPPGDRDRLLRDVVDQAEQLSVMVADLVEVAREGELAGSPVEPLLLDEVVRTAVERAAARRPDLRFHQQLESFALRGVRPLLDRAVSNLLDNASKWSPNAGVIEVTLRGGELTVRDHGAGVSDEDLPHVFDRFFRSALARSHPGSGLGLAIVKHVVEIHGGWVSAENAPGGGALFRLRFRSPV